MNDVIQLFETYPLEIDVLKYLVYFLLAIFLTVFSVLLFKKSFLLQIKFSLWRKQETFRFDMKNPKKTAYTLTFLTYRYDTPFNEELLKKLEKYKYRKEVSHFDRDTQELIKKFIEYIRQKDG